VPGSGREAAPSSLLPEADASRQICGLSVLSFVSIDHFNIKPDRIRAMAVDSRMRQRLAESLRELARQAQGTLDIPFEALAAACRRIADSPAAPSVFGAYCELVFALQSGELDTAQELFAEIAHYEPGPPGIHIQIFSDPQVDKASQRHERLFDTDPEQPFAIRPPRPEIAQACRLRIDAALDLMATADSQAFDELEVILKEIVLAVGEDTPGAMVFDGASSFMLFGAILLNAQGHATVLETVEALVHESSHNLLFGLCADGALIDNDDEERFDSPLRIDQRPMDGIVHATFVLARMHQAIQRLLDSGRLTPDQCREAAGMLASSARNYVKGWEVIQRHARLTPLGKTVMAGAQAHMSQYQ